MGFMQQSVGAHFITLMTHLTRKFKWVSEQYSESAYLEVLQITDNRA